MLILNRRLVLLSAVAGVSEMATYAGTAAVASVGVGIVVVVAVVVVAAQITERLGFGVGADRAELRLRVAEVAASG